MKKLLLVLTSIIVLSFTLKNEEKKYNFLMTQSQVNMLWNSLEVAKKAIQTSTGISMSDGIAQIQNIDSMEHVLAIQYNLQNAQDTTKKKK